MSARVVLALAVGAWVFAAVMLQWAWDARDSLTAWLRSITSRDAATSAAWSRFGRGCARAVRQR